MTEQPAQAGAGHAEAVSASGYAAELARLVTLSLRAGGVVPQDALVSEITDELVTAGVGQALVNDMKRVLGGSSDEAAMRRRAKDMVMQHYNRIAQQPQNAALAVAEDTAPQVVQKDMIVEMVTEYDADASGPDAFKDEINVVDVKVELPEAEEDVFEDDMVPEIVAEPVVAVEAPAAPHAVQADAPVVAASERAPVADAAEAVETIEAAALVAVTPAQETAPVMAITVEYEQNKKMILTPVSFGHLVDELDVAPVAEDQIAPVAVVENVVVAPVTIDVVAADAPVAQDSVTVPPVAVVGNVVEPSVDMSVAFIAPVADMQIVEAVPAPALDAPVAVESGVVEMAPVAYEQADLFAAPVATVAPQDAVTPLVVDLPEVSIEPVVAPVVADAAVTPAVMQVVMPRVTVSHVAIIQLAPQDVAAYADGVANPVFHDVQNAFSAASDELKQVVPVAQEENPVEDIRALFGIQTSDLGVDTSAEILLGDNCKDVTTAPDVFIHAVVSEPQQQEQDWYADALAQQMKAMMQYAA